MLIADDEYEIRSGLCKYFPWDETGFEVVGQAENGNQALSFLRANPVDLILCDIIMPMMNGLELAEHLRREFSHVKICFLTAHRDFEFAQRAVSLGAVQYVLKSASSAEMLEIFRGLKRDMDLERATAPPSESSCVTPQDLSAHVRSEDRDSRIVAEIRQYVCEHFDTADLDDIAKRIFMSPNYISRIFKQKTRQNFSDFLLQIKMEKAAVLLQDYRNRIYEVSEIVGYKHVKNFSRTFREYYGISPREYRDGKPFLKHSGETP